MDTLDIPQARDLASVRAVVAAVAGGASKVEQVQAQTGYSRRHVHYRTHAARVLGLLRFEADRFVVTGAGERLLATGAGTQDERAAFARAIESSPELRVLAPDLLARRPPFASDLADRMLAVARLSPATAFHRAEGLLAWRRQVLDQVKPPVAARQLTLFG